MGVVDGVISWQDYHAKRLITHGQALQLAIDSHSQIKQIVLSLQAQAKQLQQGIMKLIVTRAPETVRGYGFIPSSSGSHYEIWLKSTAMLIETAQHAHLPNTPPIPMQPATNAICLTSKLACLPEPLVGLKSLNRLDSVLASSELQRINAGSASLGFGEGLLRDLTGSWVEGTMSNVFYQLSASSAVVSSDRSNNYNQNPASDYLLRGQWFTPPLLQSGVRGVMRQVIIDALAKTKTPVIIRPLADDDLAKMTALFFSNAVRGIIPISTLSLPTAKVRRF